MLGSGYSRSGGFPVLRHSSLIVALVALLSGTAPPALAEVDAWPGRMVEEDGVLHVYNPAEPYLDVLTLVPEELFRIEGEGDEHLLGIISRIHSDENGHTYLLDSQLHCVWVFNEQGEFLRSIGREGEAPGEWTRAYNMMLMPENRVAVVQMMPSRLVLLTREGEPLDDHPLPVVSDGGMRMLLRSASAASNLVLELNAPSFETGVQSDHVRLIGVNPDGSERCFYGESTSTTSMTKIVLGKDRDGVTEMWTLGADGTLYSAPVHREYRIESHDREARLTRVIHREYESLPLNDEDRKELKKSVGYSGMAEPEYEFMDGACKRDISGLIVRDNGEIWVESSRTEREFGERMLTGSEVFDPQGRLLRVVRVELDFDPDRDWPFMVGDRIYLLQNAAGMWAARRNSSEFKTLGEDEEEAVEEGLEDIELGIVVYRLPYVCGDSTP